MRALNVGQLVQVLKQPLRRVRPALAIPHRAVVRERLLHAGGTVAVHAVQLSHWQVHGDIVWRSCIAVSTATQMLSLVCDSGMCTKASMTSFFSHGPSSRMGEEGRRPSWHPAA